jgi:hypothetical protein
VLYLEEKKNLLETLKISKTFAYFDYIDKKKKILIQKKNIVKNRLTVGRIEKLGIPKK